MARVARHFQGILERIDRPVVIFIDDLDRCRSEFVVHLLEGIQTLFNDPRVIYVIAADRRWLHTCFEKVYEHFVGTVNEPGRRLGSLFLEKAFELSVSVPRISPELRASYWSFLVQGGGSDARERLEQAEREAREEFSGAETNDGVFARLRHEPDDPIQRQARRQAAVERLATARLEESTAFFLQPFEPLLEPNPRAMKRLVNAYAVHRDLAILSGLDVLKDIERRKQLALWTILCLRWPMLEEYVLGRVAGRAEEPAPEVRALLGSDEVRHVLNGDGVGATLDLESIGMLAGLRASAAAAGVVA
jgi:hypothetical protein